MSIVSKVVYRFTCGIPFDFGFHFIQPYVQACCGLADVLFVAPFACDQVHHPCAPACVFGLYCVGCPEGSAAGLAGGVDVGTCVASVSVAFHCGSTDVHRFVHWLGHGFRVSGFGKFVA